MYARTGSEYEVRACTLVQEICFCTDPVCCLLSNSPRCSCCFFDSVLPTMDCCHANLTAPDLTAHLLSLHAEELSADILAYNCFKVGVCEYLSFESNNT